MFISAFIFVHKQDRSHQLTPYPFSFVLHPRLCRTILDFAAFPVQVASRRRHLGNVLFQHLVSELSYIYYDSIKQQERNYFRQLNLLRFGINEPLSQRSTCLLTSSTCCRNQTAPNVSTECEF